MILSSDVATTGLWITTHSGGFQEHLMLVANGEIQTMSSTLVTTSIGVAWTVTVATCMLAATPSSGSGSMRRCGRVLASMASSGWVCWVTMTGGGWQFNKGWDQVIAYSWGGLAESTGRWLQPSIYWAAPVHYPGFNVDWLFVDSNIFDVRESPWWDPEHNICGAQHSGTYAGAGCGHSGPYSVFDCSKWFGHLWDAQSGWLDAKLKESVTHQVDWQFVVTHFPPWWGEAHWKYLAWQYGIDLFVTGHVHRQDVLEQWDWRNQFKPSVCIITGGGGGITSEFWPDNNGNDDQYGSTGCKELNALSLSYPISSASNQVVK
ncbi:unnamed protein product [Durusdinium trenchii]|uniref:Calcineurin-like phosphoesterase domain-containing protein n=1 Tax=Durusdinium trenchii TaxID=1381693 RepID=A0ABP0N4Z5_9DINO